jgi:hypothetical protein
MDVMYVPQKAGFHNGIIRRRDTQCGDIIHQTVPILLILRKLTRQQTFIRPDELAPSDANVLYVYFTIEKDIQGQRKGDGKRCVAVNIDSPPEIHPQNPFHVAFTKHLSG